MKTSLKFVKIIDSKSDIVTQSWPSSGANLTNVFSIVIQIQWKIGISVTPL